MPQPSSQLVVLGRTSQPQSRTYAALAAAQPRFKHIHLCPVQHHAICVLEQVGQRGWQHCGNGGTVAMAAAAWQQQQKQQRRQQQASMAMWPDNRITRAELTPVSR